MLCEMERNLDTAMKKMKLIGLFMLLSLGLQAQWNDRVDTMYFHLGNGFVWDIITYGNPDSLSINGIKFYTTMTGTETDPIWTADQNQYLTSSDAAEIYEPIIVAGTYLTPAGEERVSGAKTFENATLKIRDATDRYNTTIQTTATADRAVTFPDAAGTIALTSNISIMTRYSAYSSGNNNVEVLADSVGITVTVANTNEFTFIIPAHVKLISAKIHLGTGFSSLKVFMGTTDMGNTTALNRWMPITQGWREDSGQQLTGLTVVMDNSGTPNYQKFTVNGLITGANNLIRIEF